MKTNGQAPPRTRKRLSDVRLSQLLDVATAVFLEKGFAAASTAEIAERANASKTTFYKRFPNKEDLFLAVVERHTDAVFLQLCDLPLDGAVEVSLLSFGKRFLELLLSREHTALVRLISAELERQPTLGEHFYRTGAKRAEVTLEQYFHTQIKNGHLGGAKAETMARHFLNLLTGSPVRWVVLGFDRNSLTTVQVKTHLKDSVHFFLRGYGSGSEEGQI